MNDMTIEETRTLLVALTSQINPLMALHVKLTKMLADAEAAAAPPAEPPPDDNLVRN